MSEPHKSAERPSPVRRLLHHRFLRSPGAWCVGVPVSLVLGSAAIVVWSLIHPLAFVAWSRTALGEGNWRVVVEDATMDYGDGVLSPSTWRWHVKGLAIIGLLPNRPSMDIDDIVLALPRPSWSQGGLVLTIPTASVRDFSLHFEEIARQPVPPPPGTGRFTLVVQQIAVEHFGMTMREGLNPEVILDAEHVSLMAPFYIMPGQRELVGDLALETAWVKVAGVLIHDLHPSRIQFTGLGLAVAAQGKIGHAVVDATLAVDPLIGPPEIRMTAHLHNATLDDLADEILGPGDMQLIGHVEATLTLVAGGKRGPGNMEGTARVNAVNAGFSRPESHRAAIVIAVHLAPFLRFDKDQNVIVGDFHGDVSFTQRGVSFDTITYEAPNSVGELRGYVRSTGISAKLHFKPRAGRGAIEWGFILRGDVRKPKVALATPAALRAWTPCEDPTNCGLRGGDAPPDPEDARAEADAEAALDRDARREAAHARKDARKNAAQKRRAGRDAKRAGR